MSQLCNIVAICPGCDRELPQRECIGLCMDCRHREAEKAAKAQDFDRALSLSQQVELLHSRVDDFGNDLD